MYAKKCDDSEKDSNDGGWLKILGGIVGVAGMAGAAYMAYTAENEVKTANSQWLGHIVCYAENGYKTDLDCLFEDKTEIESCWVYYHDIERLPSSQAFHPIIALRTKKWLYWLEKNCTGISVHRCSPSVDLTTRIRHHKNISNLRTEQTYAVLPKAPLLPFLLEHIEHDLIKKVYDTASVSHNSIGFANDVLSFLRLGPQLKWNSTVASVAPLFSKTPAGY